MKKIIAFLVIGLWWSHVFGQLSGVSNWFPYQKENKQWCFISVKDGAVLNNREFDSITEFQYAGIAKVKQNGKWGIMDTTGRMLVSAEYKTIQYSGEISWGMQPEVLFLEKENTPIKGVCNLQGIFINPFKYSRVESANSRDNNWISSPFSALENVAYSLYRCYPSNTSHFYELVNSEGKLILDSIRIKQAFRDEIHYYVNAERVVAELQFPGMGSIDRKVLEARFLTKSPAGKKYYGISTRNGNRVDGVTIIDYDGNVVNKNGPLKDFYSLSPIYFLNESKDSTVYFIGAKGDSFGMMDENGTPVIAFDYEVLNFQNNRFFGYKNQQSYCFDATFQPIAGDCLFYSDAFGIGVEQYYLVSKNKKEGVNRTDGKEIVPPVWDKLDVTHFGKGTNFIGMSKPVNDKNIPFLISRDIAVYDPLGKLLVKKSNARVRLLGNNLVFLEYKNQIELIGPDGKTIVASKKPVSNPQIGEDQYVRKEYSVVDIAKDRFVFHTLFRSVDGWLVLDTNGRIVFRSQLKDFDQAAAMVNKDSKVVGVIGMTEGQPYAVETESGLLAVPILNAGYNVRDNRIHASNRSKDSILILSLTGQILQKTKEFSENQQLGIQYTERYEQLDLDSVYTVYEAPYYRFTNYDFQPYDHALITSYQVVQRNIIGKNKDRYFLMLDTGKWMKNPRTYERIQPFTLQSFMCFNGTTVDIYNPEGELLFENCTDLKQYKGFRSFTNNGKTVWMTNEGKRYEPK